MLIIRSLLIGSFRKQILWEFGKSTVFCETCHLILSIHTSFWASRINVWLEWILSRFTTHWIFHFHCFSWWVVILLPMFCASLCVCSHGLTLCQMCLWGRCVLLSLRYFTQIYHSATEKVQNYSKFVNVIIQYVRKYVLMLKGHFWFLSLTE